MTLETDKILALIDEMMKDAASQMDDVDTRRDANTEYIALKDLKTRINKLHLPQEELIRKRTMQPVFENKTIQSIEDNQCYDLYIRTPKNTALHYRIPEMVVAVMKTAPIPPQHLWLDAWNSEGPILLNVDDL